MPSPPLGGGIMGIALVAGLMWILSRDDLQRFHMWAFICFWPALAYVSWLRGSWKRFRPRGVQR